nr:hypothetical protein [Tanacetum cinerariifolium]
FTRKLFANMKFRWAQDPVPLTPPMMVIVVGGNAAGDAPASAAAGVSQSPPPSSPETEWVVPDLVSPVVDWRPWPYVHVHFSEPESPPFPPEQTFLYEEPVEFSHVPRPTGPDNYVEPEEPDVIISMKDDTIHGGFHVESPVRSNDAPKPTADAAGRAEDPSMLTILSDKLDRCMGRIATLEKDLGTSKQVMGGVILKLVNRAKRLEKQAHLRRCKLVIVDSDEEVEVLAEVAAAKEDDIDLDEITTLATAALGSEQPAVPTENVPLTCKRSTYRRARTQFHTPAFLRFRSTISTGVPSPTVVPEPAASYVASDTDGPSVPADKGKAPMPDLDIPVEFLAED